MVSPHETSATAGADSFSASTISKSAAPAIGGTDMRKENSAAFSGSTFDARAAASVIPERDTPGRMAIACAMPITIAWKNPTPSLPRDRKRVAVSTSPVKTSAAPTSFGEAKASSIRSLSRIPTTAAGTALTTIFTQ